VRIYLPATSTALESLLASGVIDRNPLTAFAVTPALREWYASGDEEELEYVATNEAARASLRLISSDSAAIARRVVIAADVDDSVVTVRDDLDRGVVRISGPIELASCASIHIDDAEAEPVVRLATAAIDAADMGDEAAEDVVDDTEGFELSWYANQELAALLASFGH
jgi:hypothetical protein